MRLPDTIIKRDEKFITIRIPLQVVAGMTQEYWDILAINARRLVPDVAPVPNLTGKVENPFTNQPKEPHV